MAATERVPVLVSRTEKARLAKKAKVAGLTMGEYLRRAADAYDPLVEEGQLESLIERVRASTAEASEILDRALARCVQSERRIVAMEAEHAAGRERGSAVRHA